MQPWNSLLHFKNFSSSYLDIAWKILLHFQSTARWEKGHDQSYQQTPYLKILTNKLHSQWLDLEKKIKNTHTMKSDFIKYNPINSTIFSLFKRQKSIDWKLLQNNFSFLCQISDPK